MFDWNLHQSNEVEVLRGRAWNWDAEGKLGGRADVLKIKGCPKNRYQLDLRFRGTFSETMELRTFPFDNQEFHLMFEIRMDKYVREQRNPVCR